MTRDTGSDPDGHCGRDHDVGSGSRRHDTAAAATETSLARAAGPAMVQVAPAATVGRSAPSANQGAIIWKLFAIVRIIWNTVITWLLFGYCLMIICEYLMQINIDYSMIIHNYLNY